MKRLRHSFIIFLLILSHSSPIFAAGNSITTEATLAHLMKAIAQKDRDAFINVGTAEFKASITPRVFNSVTEQLSGPIQNGYTSEYLATLKQQGYSVHLWKISYDNHEDDSLARLVMDNGEVAGFWLQ